MSAESEIGGTAVFTIQVSGAAPDSAGSSHTSAPHGASSSLSAFDFFSIVIWKSNRAKSKIAAGLRTGTHTDLDNAVRALTQQAHDAPGPEARLKTKIVEELA